MSFPTEVLCGKTTTEDGIIIASVPVCVYPVRAGRKGLYGDCLFGRIFRFAGRDRPTCGSKPRLSLPSTSSSGV